MSEIDKNKIIGKSLMFIGIFIIAIAITGFDPIRINQDGDIFLGDQYLLILNSETNECMYDVNENKTYPLFESPNYIVKNHPSRLLFCNMKINTTYNLEINNLNSHETVLLQVRNASQSMQYQVQRNGFITFFQWVNISNILDIKHGDEITFKFYPKNSPNVYTITWSYVMELPKGY